MGKNVVVIFEASIAKELEYQIENEDSYSYSVENNIVTLSDGASQSFDAKRWSTIITNNIHEPITDMGSWIARIISQYESSYKKEEFNWIQQLSYKKGSYATLLFLHYDVIKHRVNIIGIGDSVAVLLNGNNFVQSYPYKESHQFAANPVLLSTIQDHNNQILDNRDTIEHSMELNGVNDPHILCMSDAIAKWAFQKHEEGYNPWKLLSEFESINQFTSMVVKERANKSMRIDDTTIIHLKVSEQ